MDIIQLVKKNLNNIKQDIIVLKIFLFNKVCDETNKLEYIENITKGFDERIEILEKNQTEENRNLLENDYYTVKSLLEELKEDIVSKEKIVSVVLINNLKLYELELFFDEFQKIMKNYENIQQASSDIFYHSGLELSSFICELINYLDTHNVANSKLIPLDYLKNYQTIITLSMMEWINLLKVIKTTMKYLTKEENEQIEKLRTKLITLNVYNFIVVTGGDI